jgi:hypothetical protein
MRNQQAKAAVIVRLAADHLRILIFEPAPDHLETAPDHLAALRGQLRRHGIDPVVAIGNDHAGREKFETAVPPRR